MSLAVLHSRALTDMRAPPVSVEAHLANGLPAFRNVGQITPANLYGAPTWTVHRLKI
jgi:hypothetical protein